MTRSLLQNPGQVYVTVQLRRTTSKRPQFAVNPYDSAGRKQKKRQEEVECLSDRKSGSDRKLRARPSHRTKIGASTRIEFESRIFSFIFGIQT
jgi:hypothetical protein